MGMKDSDDKKILAAMYRAILNERSNGVDGKWVEVITGTEQNWTNDVF